MSTSIDINRLVFYVFSFTIFLSSVFLHVFFRSAIFPNHSITASFSPAEKKSAEIMFNLRRSLDDYSYIMSDGQMTFF